VAIASTIFAAHSQVGGPAAVATGFRSALWVCVCFAVLAAISGLATTSIRQRTSGQIEPADVLAAA
jgi:hypothetical protein